MNNIINEQRVQVRVDWQCNVQSSLDPTERVNISCLFFFIYIKTPPIKISILPEFLTHSPVPMMYRKFL